MVIGLKLKVDSYVTVLENRGYSEEVSLKTNSHQVFWNIEHYFRYITDKWTTGNNPRWEGNLLCLFAL